MPTKSIPPVAPVTSHREPRTRIRVLVVDDHPAVRVGARNLIDDQPDMEVVAEARSAEEVLLQSNHQVDVAVVDYQLGAGDDGLRLTAQLKQLERPPAVLVYSAFADSALAVLALVAGADGLLSKHELGEELCSAIRRLARGQHHLPAINSSVAQVLRSHAAPRDQAIFGMLVHGISPETIVERLGITSDELNARRAIILGSLRTGRRDFTVLSGSRAPLDYERPRRRAKPRGRATDQVAL